MLACLHDACTHDACIHDACMYVSGSILHPLMAGCRYDACIYDACPPAAAAAPPIENMVKFRYQPTNKAILGVGYDLCDKT